MYFGLGIVIGAHGPALPELAANTRSTLAGVGTFFTAFFLGALVAQIIAGRLNDRFGQRPVLLVGLILLGLGELGLTLSNTRVMLWGSALIIGFGAGPVQISLTLLVTELFPERRSAVMN
jgi:DHA1 family bicyclomycin/chloramphenicol resistance-like MFS transporter